MSVVVFQFPYQITPPPGALLCRMRFFFENWQNGRKTTGAANTVVSRRGFRGGGRPSAGACRSFERACTMDSDDAVGVGFRNPAQRLQVRRHELGFAFPEDAEYLRGLHPDPVVAVAQQLREDLHGSPVRVGRVGRDVFRRPDEAQADACRVVAGKPEQTGPVRFDQAKIAAPDPGSARQVPCRVPIQTRYQNLAAGVRWTITNSV